MISFHESYWFALAAAFLSALGALFMKRAFQGGLSALNGILFGNWLFLAMILPTWWVLSPVTPYRELWWLPLVSGGILTMGVYANFLALHRGAVSVATPLLGLKTLFIALISALVLGEMVPVPYWIAAFLCLVALALFSYHDTKKKPVALMHTILLSVLSAFCFALLDILIQEYGKRFGFFHLMIIAQSILCGFSTLIFFVVKPAKGKLSVATSFWLFMGTLFIASGFMVLSSTIAYYQTATALNVVFSVRGLFSVLLVWTVGPLVRNRERDEGAGILTLRLIGAGLLMCAILILSLE